MSLLQAPYIASAPRIALGEPSLGEIVDAARAGDEHAWTALVRRMEPRLRRVVRRFGLSSAQTDDVLQIAWLRLFENLGALRASDAVGAWLTVTARREALLMLQGRVREIVTDDPCAGEVADASGP
jgi:DNA-directed RNA polymerase specialized sigma24 family protein